MAMRQPQRRAVTWAVIGTIVLVVGAVAIIVGAIEPHPPRRPPLRFRRPDPT